jgi:hypothetical protein
MANYKILSIIKIIISINYKITESKGGVISNIQDQTIHRPSFRECTHLITLGITHTYGYPELTPTNAPFGSAIQWMY